MAERLRDFDSMQDWDKVAVAILQSPSMVGILASFGYVGHLLLSGEPITKRRIVGGVMLAMFTGTAAYFFGVGLGLPEKLVIPAAMLTGSVCEVGYVALTQRALGILGKKTDP
jgi:drug/metabolite transporter (DMT)-like permease